MSWWQTGVLYQIYPRSFADSNGDGIGDLRGIIDRLEYLEWLGVDGIWLSPITVSPNVDWGYDVSDYCNVQPEYGTLADVDELIAAAGRRDIRVILDLVPNHTSSAHPWFLDARSSNDSTHRDWYVWADGRPDGSPPNNWISNFRGPAWTLDEKTQQYYLHNFDPGQPDLNWWSDEVRSAFDDIYRFWFDRGVAGFRIDVCHMIVKDRELRDNPPITDRDAGHHRRLGQVPLYNANRPELHDVLRRWRKIAESYDPPRVLLGETVVFDLDVVRGFYGDGDELNLAMNMPFVAAPLQAEPMRAIVESVEALLGEDAWPVWLGSNHDVPRLATRWAGGEEAKARLALLMLLTLRGTPLLYQGDEIGLQDTELRREDILDPVGVKLWPRSTGRDPARTPMQWSSAPGAGFTTPDAKPWLPFGDVASCNVEDQRADEGSSLHLVRDVIDLRRRTPDLQRGGYATIPSGDAIWAWRRGTGVVVALNLGEERGVVPDVDGTVLVGTDRSRDGAVIGGKLELSPYEGVVIGAATV